MKALIPFFLLISAISVSLVKIPYKQGSITIESSIPEKCTISKNCFEQKGLFRFCGAKVNFRARKLKRFDFSLSFEEDRQNNAMVPALTITDTVKSETNGPFMVEVLKVSSSHPAYSIYGKEIQVIHIVKEQDGVYINLLNLSKADDNVSPEFLMRKFSEIEFHLSAKK